MILSAVPAVSKIKNNKNEVEHSHSGGGGERESVPVQGYNKN